MHLQTHSQFGKYMRSIIYGGLDGLLSTMAIVIPSFGFYPSSAINLESSKIFILGIASVIAGSISMALSDYISTKSEIQFCNTERTRQNWEVQNNPQQEKQEMIQIYRDKGIGIQEAVQIVQIISKNKEAFVSVMMLEQLGIKNCQDNPIKKAFATFFSFMICGFIPLIPYLIAIIRFPNQGDPEFISCCAFAQVELMVLGILKGLYCTQQYIKETLITISSGTIVLAIGYGIAIPFQIKQ